jgi:CheY-like chemotaxis protein
VIDFRIVLVEDSVSDVLLIKEALRHHGVDHSLEHYINGEDAAQAIAAAVDAPDLFLLDLNVPRVHGLELLRIIRELPAMAHVPVVIITSSRAASDRAQSQQLGADAYIVKPLGYTDFKNNVGRTIADLLRRKPRAVCEHRFLRTSAPADSARRAARLRSATPGRSRSEYRSPRFSLREF